MQKIETGLSPRAYTALLFTFYIGYLGIQHTALPVGRDGWLSMLVGFILSVPMLFLLARLTILLPGMHLFEMLEYGFGRVLSYLTTVIYLTYFLTLTTTALGQITFIRTVSLPSTPLIVLLLLFFVTAAYFAHLGVYPIGKWSVLAAMIIIGITLLLSILAVPSLRISNLLPMGAAEGGALLRGGYQFMISPIGAGVVLLTLLRRGCGQVRFYKVFFFGAGLATLFFVLAFLRDTAILGIGTMEHLPYPAYHAASAMQISTRSGRVDSLVTISVLLSTLTMLAVCLYAVAVTLRRLTARCVANSMILPGTTIALGLTLFLRMDFAVGFPLNSIYLRYAPIIQSLIPAVLWLVVEVKRRRKSL